MLEILGFILFHPNWKSSFNFLEFAMYNLSFLISHLIKATLTSLHLLENTPNHPCISQLHCHLFDKLPHLIQLKKQKIKLSKMLHFYIIQPSILILFFFFYHISTSIFAVSEHILYMSTQEEKAISLLPHDKMHFFFFTV